jgi:hypothetical protein
VVCAVCGVKREKLPFLSPSPKFTRRFALVVGNLCRAMSIRDVAKRMNLDWRTIKELDKLYMREQLRVAGHPAPRAIGVDEISIRKGHEYRIVVSDLDEGRAIWFGGEGRTEKDMDPFFASTARTAHTPNHCWMIGRTTFQLSYATNDGVASYASDPRHHRYTAVADRFRFRCGKTSKTPFIQNRSQGLIAQSYPRFINHPWILLQGYPMRNPPIK